MKLITEFVLIIIFQVQISFGVLSSCSEVMQKVCYITKDYKHGINPEPLPTKINITLKVFEVIDVKDNHQTLTLSMRATIEWNDQRLSVNRSEEYTEK